MVNNKKMKKGSKTFVTMVSLIYVLYFRFILSDTYHQDQMNDILATSKMVTPHSQNGIMHVI